MVGPQSLKGVFVQVRQGDGSGSVVGEFTEPSSDGFKTLACFGKPRSAFSHASSSPKGQAIATQWSVPNDCQGTLTIK